jgi:tetratricopeptide (TPR) repeat protein
MCILRTLLVVACLAPGVSLAKSGTLEKARAHFADATRDYNLGEYRQALEEFRAAYKEHQEPLLLFDIAQCYRQLADKGQAITLYRSYLRELPDAPNRALVEGLIASLDRELHALPAAPAPALEPRAVAAPAPAVATPAPAPAIDVRVRGPERARTPLVKKAWFWGVVGGAAAVVALGVGLGVGLSSNVSYPSASTTLGVVRW